MFEAKFPKGSLLLIEGNVEVTIPSTAEAMKVHALLQENKPFYYDVSSSLEIQVAYQPL